MKLDDQVLLSKHNNNYKIIVLSGYMDEDQDRLVASDLFGNMLYIDWDLASYGQHKNHRFKYSHNKNTLELLIHQEELMQELGLVSDQEITLEQLIKVEKYLNSKEQTNVL